MKDFPIASMSDISINIFSTPTKFKALFLEQGKINKDDLNVPKTTV